MQLSLLEWQPPAPAPVPIGWSAEADALLAQMYRESDCPDVAEIARACGKSYRATASRASRMGLTSRSSDAKMRRCLGGCDRLFMSDNRGNRICMSCKRTTQEYACA